MKSEKGQSLVMVGVALGIFAYVEGNFNYSRYLLLPHIKGAGEVLVFCAAMAGARFYAFFSSPVLVCSPADCSDLGHLLAGAGQRPDVR